MGVIPGGWWCAYIAAAPLHTGVALMRRHQREGGVQCRAGSTHELATGLSVAAGWESRSPSEVESDDQAINPARGGVCRLLELEGRGAHRPAAPWISKASGGDAARVKVFAAEAWGYSRRGRCDSAYRHRPRTVRPARSERA